jgi:ABC-type Fe3+ transport system permease subunit
VGSIAINAGMSADGLKAAKSAALWLYSNGAGEDALTETLGVVIYNYTSAGYTTYACALSTVVCITILTLVLLYRGVSAILRHKMGRNG